jgi:hypothetical protein
MKIIAYFASILILFLLFCKAGRAQDAWHYRSRVAAGLLSGEAGRAFQAQWISGMQQKNNLLALGVGYDAYLYNSMPLFVSLNHYLPAVGPLYFTLKAGPQLILNRKKLYDATTYKLDKAWPAFYWAGGAGYEWKWKDAKGKSLLFEFSYSGKRLKQRLSSSGFCIDPPCQIQTETYLYNTQSWSFLMGMCF